jgi:hypothetical protein
MHRIGEFLIEVFPKFISDFDYPEHLQPGGGRAALVSKALAHSDGRAYGGGLWMRKIASR